MPDKPDYLDDLVLELRVLDVPGDRIGEIMAETESHLAESEESPEQTFGAVGDYARELVAREGEAPPRVVDTSSTLSLILSGMKASDWVILVASFTVTGIGAAALLNGVLALGFGADTWFGLPAWLLVVVGVLLIGAFLLGVRRLDDPIIDPRTGRRVEFDRRGRRRSSD